MSRWVLVAVVFLALGMASPAFAQNPHVGTWKQNAAKSKVDPPPTTPPPQSVTWKYEAFEGDGVKMTVDTVGADGKHTMTTPYSAHIDGKDYPFAGNATIDTIALKRVDASSWDYTMKKAGKVVRTGRNTVSRDGKTIRYTSKGTNASGQPTSGVSVYEKQ